MRSRVEKGDVLGWTPSNLSCYSISVLRIKNKGDILVKIACCKLSDNHAL